MRRTILVTGFGPFPGAPYNPTASLVRKLARHPRLKLGGIDLVAHIFPTSYAVVDRELPALIKRHKPCALLMFGLAARRKILSIETRARNAIANLPDVDGMLPAARSIASGGLSHLALRLPAQRLLRAARRARVPTALSRDAGRYLCNYLCWRAIEASRKRGGPATTVFIHVPDTGRGASPQARGRAKRPNNRDLLRAGVAFTVAVAAACHG